MLHGAQQKEMASGECQPEGSAPVALVGTDQKPQNHRSSGSAPSRGPEQVHIPKPGENAIPDTGTVVYPAGDSPERCYELDGLEIVRVDRVELCGEASYVVLCPKRGSDYERFILLTDWEQSWEESFAFPGETNDASPENSDRDGSCRRAGGCVRGDSAQSASNAAGLDDRAADRCVSA